MKVTILNKSINTATGDVITSFLLEGVPKFLLAEFNTHRLISKNWESSRARPVRSVISQVLDDPYIPRFTGNQPGMQGADLDPFVQQIAAAEWLKARDSALQCAKKLESDGVHKQDTNRLLESWMKVSGIVTATEWGQFYALRNSDNAQPAFAEIASEMNRLHQSTCPVPLRPGQWHKPWADLSLVENTARIASVSYANHGKNRSPEEHQRLHDDLARNKHSSPFEHCAIALAKEHDIGTSYRVFDHFHPESTAFGFTTSRCPVSTGNFAGFLQYRRFVELGIEVAET